MVLRNWLVGWKFSSKAGKSTRRQAGKAVGREAQGLEDRTLLSGISFAWQSGGASPFDGFNVGLRSSATLGDLDGDGDLDAIAGEIDGTLKYFLNTGTATVPAFTEQTGSANPVQSVNSDQVTTPVLGDMDGDGDLDLIIGGNSGGFVYYKNTGTATAAVFTQQYNTDNPMQGFAVSWNSTPTLGDLDGDGDLDLISGEQDGEFSYFENTGTKLAPVFTQRFGASNPLDGTAYGFNLAPTLGDLDGDGDLDLISGIGNGNFRFFANTGTKVSPTFVELTGNENPLKDLWTLGNSVPTLGDLDSDGDLDLVSGRYGGELWYFKNTTAPMLAVGFTQQTGSENSLDNWNFGIYGTPSLVDLDADGDLDLVTGSSGTFYFMENVGSAINPVYENRAMGDNPLFGISVPGYSAPTLGDLDGDGDFDFLAGNNLGAILYFKNTGTASAPVFTQQMGGANPLNGIVVEEMSRSTLGDLDGDGDLDLVVGGPQGIFTYFKNTGTATLPAFTQQTGSANPLNGFDAGWMTSPVLLDTDLDGDLDVISGKIDGTFAYYRNTGTATAPAFTELTGPGNPLNGFEFEDYSTPTWGDLDGDGDPDLIVGNDQGLFSYLVNNLSPTDLELSNDSLAENSASGTVVGTLATVDPNGADTFNYSLVSGTGDTDNSAFSIVGNELRTAGVFNFESKSSYSIRVRTTDQAGAFFEEAFTILVTNVNETPTDIGLTNDSVAENSASGSAVGGFSTVDPDAANTFTYTLVSGTGDSDNEAFQLMGNQLVTAGVFSFETKNSYSIRVRTTDQGGEFVEEEFMITVTNVNETPTDIGLTNNSVEENSAIGTGIGDFSSTDPDSGNTFTYTLVGGSGSDDNGSFAIVGNQLQVGAGLNFEAKSSYTIRVRSTDQGGEFFEKVFPVSVTDVNESPTDIGMTNNSVAENIAIGTGIGDFSSTDPDGGNTFTYSLVSGSGGTDNSSFAIVGNQLRTGVILNYEGQSVYSVRVRTTDQDGKFFDEVFTISATDVNDAPLLTAGVFPRLPNWFRKSKTNPGETIANVIASLSPVVPIADQDAGALKGFAVIDAANANGTWQYSIDGGTAWLSLSDASTTNARLLNENAKLRFVPFKKKFSGEVALSVAAWDQVTGTNGGTADVSLRGGTTSFSTEITQVRKTVLKKKPKN